MLHRLFTVVLLIATCWGMLCPRAIAAPAEGQLLAELVRNELKVHPPQREWSGFVDLAPDRVSWSNGRLTWICRTREPLSTSQRDQVVKDMEAYLGSVLTRPDPKTGQRLSDERAQAVIRASILGVARRPKPSDLTEQHLRAALAACLERQARQTQRLQADFYLTPPDLLYQPGQLAWVVRPRVWGPPGEEPSSAKRRQGLDVLEKHRQELTQLLGRAVSDFGVGESDLPLLDPDEFRALAVSVDAFPPSWCTRDAVVSAGASRYHAAVVKGFARRTIQAVRQATAELAAAVNSTGRDSQRGAYVTPLPTVSGPRLVADLGGFVGATVNQLAFSPDGRHLAAGGEVVRIWDLKTGQLLHTLRGQLERGGAGSCTDLAYSPGGEFLLVATSGFNASPRVYDTGDFSQIADVLGGHDGHVERLAFSPDGRSLVTAGSDGDIHVWDWERRTITKSLHVGQGVKAIDYLGFPSRKPYVLAIDVQGHYVYWNVETESAGEVGERCAALEGVFSANRRWPHQGQVHPFALALDFDRSLFLAGGLGQEVWQGASRWRYWCGLWEGGAVQARHVLEHCYFVTAAALSADREQAATADGLGQIHVWSLATGREIRTFQPANRAVYAAEFDGLESQVAFGRTPRKGSDFTWNHYGRLDQRFDLAARTVDVLPEPRDPQPLASEHGGIRLARHYQDGTYVFTVYDGNRPQASFPYISSSKAQPLCYGLLSSPQSCLPGGMVIGGEDGSLTVLDSRTLLPTRIFTGHQDRVWAVSEARRGDLLASACGDGIIRMWSLKNLGSRGDLAALADEDGEIYHVIPNTPTAKAGIRERDRILQIGAFPAGELAHVLAAREPWPLQAGETVTVKLERPGQPEPQAVEVELSNMGDLSEPLLSLFVSDDDRQWIIWTNQGYYDSSLGGDRFIGWHLNRGRNRAAEFFSAAHFRHELYRPDIIDLTIKLGDVGEAIRLANRTPESGVPSPGAPVREPPLVQILEPSDGTRTGSAQITVRAEIWSPTGEPLTEARVLVNGKAFRATPKNIERASEGGTASTPPSADTAAVPPPEHLSKTLWRIEQEVTLREGENTLAVVASTKAAISETRDVSVYCRPSPAPDNRRKPTLYVAAIGVAKYQQQQLRLEFADRDAEEFAARWDTQRGDLYGAIETRVVTNEQATQQGVLQVMQWLFAKPQPDDLAVLFLSGHGIVDQVGDYYFATFEADPANLFVSALPWSRIQDYHLRLPCRSLLFVDTCHGAGAAGAGSPVRDPLFNLPREDAGVAVFAACSHRAPSYEDPALKHGIFTAALLKTFDDPGSDGDTPRDGFLSLSELGRNVCRRVEELSRGRPQPQHARFQIPLTIEDIDIYRLP